MKITYSLTLIFILFLFANCSKSENPNPKPDDEIQIDSITKEPKSEVYFTYNVDSKVDTSNSENWIIVHKDNGELLDFRPYEGGDKLVFETLENQLTENLMITTLLVNDNNDKKNYFHRTFMEIPKGSVWTAVSQTWEESTRNPITGSFNLTVTNAPIILNLVVSDSNGLLASCLCNNNSTPVYIPDSVGEILVTVNYVDGNTRYAVIDDIQQGSNVILDYGSFTPLDKKLEVSFPPNGRAEGYILAFEEEQNPSLLTGNWLSGPLDSQNGIINYKFNMGYLDRFKNYITHFEFSTDEYSYNFNMLGEEIQKIEIPQNLSISIQNYSIESFQFSTNATYKKRISYWSSNNESAYVSYRVFSSNTFSGKIGEIPQDIIALYPDIDIIQLQYDQTTILLDNESYSEYIEKLFVTHEGFGNEQAYTFYKQN